MKKTAIIAAMLLLGAARAVAQVPWQTDDSCLCLYQDYYPGLWYNPDSVMVDTCAYYMGISKSDLPWYAKRWYRITLDSDYFHFPAAPIDTIIQTTWQQLDTIYDTARAEFDSLQRQYGPFVLRKFYPNETSGELSGAYHIGFDSILEVGAVLTTLEGLFQSGGDGFSSTPIPIDNGVNDPTQRITNHATAFPNPTSRESWISCSNGLICNATVTDVIGRAVRKIAISPPSTEFKINLDGLNAGIYNISVEGNLITRIILQP
jgi:hypothetical protein